MQLYTCVDVASREEPLLKDVTRHSYVKLTVCITRVWEHWSADSTVLYGVNFFMIDRKWYNGMNNSSGQKASL